MTLATFIQCVVTAFVVSLVVVGGINAVPWYRMKRSQYRLRLAIADAEAERLLAGYRPNDVSRETEQR